MRYVTLGGELKTLVSTVRFCARPPFLSSAQQTRGSGIITGAGKNRNGRPTVLMRIAQ
jgi:hypothetical protein